MRTIHLLMLIIAIISLLTQKIFSYQIRYKLNKKNLINNYNNYDNNNNIFNNIRSNTKLHDIPSFLTSADFTRVINIASNYIQPIIDGPIGNFIKTIINNDKVTSELTIIPSSSLDPLGNDLLIFLFTTIGIVPLFKWLEASPVLGFLSAGLVMGPAGLGLFEDLSDMEALAEFGVLFLLFEQGLELTVERLQSLSKYAFGMGTAQVLLCTIAFFAFPFLGGVQFLEFFVGSDANVVDITRIDESLVIGAALSLSSSAFVLKILQEKGQLSTKFGSAALGILLMQDIAVVPLLVLLPIIESNDSGVLSLTDQIALLGATVAKAVLGLGGILVIGGAIVRSLFAIVARSQSSETFVALCLLVAVGIGALTDSLGLSSTLGAFVAGTLLAESNYRTQIETDIKPFKGLLLGLFFLTTGASVDPYVIQEQWPTVFALLFGLLAFKTAIITALGPIFDLTKAESVRTGLLLSGGGEFAFVVLTLADKLRVIPDQLAKILVGVVVLSMALTPYLSILGDQLAVFIQDYENKQAYQNALLNSELGSNEFNTDYSRSSTSSSGSIDSNIISYNENNDSNIYDDSLKIKPEQQQQQQLSVNNHSSGHGSSISDAIIVCGYGAIGDTIVRFLTSPKLKEQMGSSINYMAFDLDPTLVINGYKNGYRILYGDGSQPLVLETAGISSPKAFVVTYGDSEASFKAVERLRQAFPFIPIIAR
jgi:Kef-type K+ transport system membrane component KefB